MLTRCLPSSLHGFNWKGNSFVNTMARVKPTPVTQALYIAGRITQLPIHWQKVSYMHGINGKITIVHVLFMKH